MLRSARPFIFSVLLVTLLSSCGGSDNSGTTDTTDPGMFDPGVFTGFTGDLEFVLDPAATSIGAGADGQGGIAVGSNIGTIRNAIIAVFRLSDGGEIGRASTGDTGLVTLRLPADFTGGVIVELSGTEDSEYFDVTQNAFRDFPADAVLRGVKTRIPGNIGVGMFTEAVVSATLASLPAATGTSAARAGLQQRAAAELNSLVVSDIESRVKQLEQKVEFSKVFANAPVFAAGISAKRVSGIFPDDVAMAPPSLPGFVPIPYPSFSMTPSRSRVAQTKSTTMLARRYARFNPLSDSPVYDLTVDYVSDIADDETQNFSSPASGTGYSLTFKQDLKWGIRFAYDDLQFDMDERPLASHTLFSANDQGGQDIFQSVFFNSGRLTGFPVQPDGSTGAMTDIGTYNYTENGFPGSDFAAWPVGKPNSIETIGTNANNYNDQPSSIIFGGINRQSVSHNKPIFSYHRANNLGGFTDSDFAAMPDVLFYGFPDGSLGTESGAPQVSAATPVAISLDNVINQSIANPPVTDFLVFPTTGDTVAVDTENLYSSKVSNPVPLTASGIGLAPVRSFRLTAASPDTTYVDNGFDLLMLSTIDNLALQGCLVGKGVAGSPFLMASTAGSIFGAKVILDVMAVGDTVYWVVLDTSGIPVYQLWSCGLSQDPNDPGAQPIAQQPRNIFSSAEMLTLFRPQPGGVAGIAFVGMAGGPKPVDGHTLFALAFGNLLSELFGLANDDEQEVIDVSDFQVRFTDRRLEEIGGSSVEFVKYFLSNSATNQAMVLYTRSDIDPDGGEGAFKFELFKTDEIQIDATTVSEPFLSMWGELENKTSEAFESLTSQSVLQGVDRFGDQFEFNTAVKNDMGKTVKLEGRIRKP